jgi:DNA-binding transcriptional LysR family regulator
MMRRTMELRHLRYYVAVAEALNFTKAAERLRVAQPALSRQVQDLEDEIGVDLMKRSPRGVTLTAEGKLYLAEARAILAAADESVKKVQALARGDFGELHVGYGPSPSIELLPPALAAFQKAAPRVNVVLHDLAGNELCDGLRDASLELAVMSRPLEDNTRGLEFETLRSYPFCVAVAPWHPLAKMKTVTMTRLAEESLVVFRKKEYTDYHRLLGRVFTGVERKPRIAVECDGASTLITEIETGRGVAVLPSVFARVTGARLKFRPLTPAPAPLDVGICRAAKGDVTPAGEKFCAQLRQIAKTG